MNLRKVNVKRKKSYSRIHLARQAFYVYLCRILYEIVFLIEISFNHTFSFFQTFTSHIYVLAIFNDFPEIFSEILKCQSLFYKNRFWEKERKWFVLLSRACLLVQLSSDSFSLTRYSISSSLLRIIFFRRSFLFVELRVAFCLLAQITIDSTSCSLFLPFYGPEFLILMRRCAIFKEEFRSQMIKTLKGNEIFVCSV